MDAHPPRCERSRRRGRCELRGAPSAIRQRPHYRQHRKGRSGVPRGKVPHLLRHLAAGHRTSSDTGERPRRRLSIRACEMRQLADGCRTLKGGPTMATQTQTALQVNAIMIGVKDLARAKKFYGEGLGCKTEQDYPAFVKFTLGDGSSSLALYEREAAAKDA